MTEQTVIYGTSERGTNKTYPIELDGFSGALQTITSEHHSIHEGDAFTYIDSNSLGNNVTQDYLLVTHATSEYINNLTYEIESTLVATVSLYEATDKTGSAEVLPFNRNRNLADASLTKIYKGTAGGTTDGTLLYTTTIGTSVSGAKTGGLDRNNDEIMLKKNTKYIIRVTSGAASNRVNIKMSYYEHPWFYE